MIYLLNALDFELFDIDSRMVRADIWEASEERVKRWIENERTRSIFTRVEIINFFDTGKIQMVQVDKISPKPFDKIIVWTPNKKFFVIEIVQFI